MRKMKKINGYFIVRFNDLEKRENEGTGLGSFGVIDAELYSGNLAIDRSVMEYDDAETIEIAVEQARGLDSEFDVEEPEVKVTIIKETNGKTTEMTYDPVRMFTITRTLLEMDIQKGVGEDIDARTAAHELRGLTNALITMGVISGEDERFYVPLDCFEHVRPRINLESAALEEPTKEENRLSYICDELCKYRAASTTQGELDAICEKCEVTRIAFVPPDLTAEETQGLRRFLNELNDYSNNKPATPPPRDRFQHLPSDRFIWSSEKLYRLGAALDKSCPENDCIIYRNIFRQAREIDKTLDNLSGYSADVLQRELQNKVRELCQLYLKNYAVKTYRNGLNAL